MHVTILTGAGISAESGIPTFRDSNGLWENHKVEEVATPGAWLENPELVWRFYQERRRSMEGIEPNAAHYALVDLEERLEDVGFKFTLITQNIDGLHLMAGSKNVIEMHGALRKLICQKCKHVVEGYDYLDDSFLPCPECKWRMMRPDVVWFDEMPKNPEKYHVAVESCTQFASIGTSGEVWPAAGFINTARKNGAWLYFSNIEEPSLMLKEIGAVCFVGPATEAVPAMCGEIKRIC